MRLWKGLAVGASLAAMGCAEEVKDVDRTQPNALRKELFQGTWYFARTVVDAPYETQDTFVGDRQEYLWGEDFPAYKIRWRIEENHLLACRVDEVVVGSNSDGARLEDYEDIETGKPGVTADLEVDKEASGEEDRQNDEYGADEKFPCRHPVASFAIQEHFDIQRAYNAATGEQSNVIEENGSDRPWYQRQYFRIDWTDQSVTDLAPNLTGFEKLGWLNLQSAYYVQEEDGDCRVVGEDGKIDYRTCEEGYLPPVLEDDSILITNRMTVAPGDGLLACAYGYDPNCALNEIGMRYSFMRLPTRPLEQEYVPLAYPDDAFERYGLWRVNKPTYVPGRGETDFRQYLATRWNIFEKWRDADGKPLAKPEGLKKINYWLNREFPNDLKPTAFKMAKEWSDAYAGIHPGVDVVNDCKAVCGNGKSIEDCTGSDTNFRMEGPCVFNLQENDGSQFLGDLRYSMIAFIQDPSYGQPCGVGGPANDPETGEMINGVAYIYGNGCFDYLETRLTDMLDLLCAQHAEAGESSLPAACRVEERCMEAAGSDAETQAQCIGLNENQFLRGRQILDIMQGQGYVQRVPTPIQSLDALAKMNGGERSNELTNLHGKMVELKNHREKLHLNRARLQGSELERAMIPDELATELTGGRAHSAAELTDEEIERINPLDPVNGELVKGTQRRDRLAARAVEPAEYLFNDSALWAMAQRLKNLDRHEFRQFVREQAFRAVTLHELGHNMGLRHNFIASFDRVNFFPEYWSTKKEIREKFAEETGREFRDLNPNRGSDETAEAFLARYEQWNADRETIRLMEREAGLKEVQYTSIMDYHAMYYSDWRGLGSYDKAAMRFAHAGLVDRVDCEASEPEDCNLADSAREHVQWYGGGQLCYSDDDCPAKERGQKCRANEDLGAKTCSSWDDDEVDSGRFVVRHKFCSDERVDDQPFCNRFDEGDTSEEIVRNMIEQYEQMYPFRAFRRSNANFSAWGYFNRVFGSFRQVGDQMQSMIYKYFNEVGFRNNEGPGGLSDMLRASIIGFEFLGNVLARPDSGPYVWDPTDAQFEYPDSDEGRSTLESDTNITIPIGVGKPMFSSYERGYFGETNRLSYIGSYYDKFAAMYILSLRDFGTRSGNNEERYLLSFYDIFPSSYAKLMGAYITGDKRAVSMNYDRETKKLYERKIWDGGIFGPDSEFDPSTSEVPGVPIEPRPVSIQNIDALVYSALNVPYYADPSFAEMLRVFELGGETGFSLNGAGGIGGVPADKIVSYTSPLTHRTFVAVQTEELPSISAAAVQRATELKGRMDTLSEEIEACEVNADCQFSFEIRGLEPAREARDDLERELRSQETTLSQFVWLVDVLGISTIN